MPKSPPQLSRFELQVLRLLWTRGEAAVAQLHGDIPDAPSYSTIRKIVEQKLKPALKRVEVEQGVAGGAPNSPPAYVAVCHLSFDSIAAFEKAFNPNADAIMSDIPNYTDIEPVIQISEVKMA